MALSKEQVNSIEEVLKASLRNKFQNYKPEASSKQFHTRLLGKDRLASYEFIHSLNTNFGTTVFEPVTKILAKDKFIAAETQVKPPKTISSHSQTKIQDIMDELVSGRGNPDKFREI